jgi:hypothetical protein
MVDFDSTSAIEALAADIGENIYIDVAKWHLYLADAHLHTAVAEKVAPLLEKGTLSLEAVQKILSEIQVPLGGGKLTVSLADLVPATGQQSLLQLLQDLQEQ